MAVEYEKFAFDAMGTALEDDEDRMEEERKTGGGIMGKLRTAIGKAAKDNPAKADTESVAAAMKDGKAAVNPVAAKNALVASPETKQREQDLLKRAQSLAVRMGQAGAVNPMLASSSHGAGRLSSIVLRQEPRGQLFWSDGQRRGYPLAKLYRAYGSSLARSKAGAKLPVLVADYRTKVGTIDPILDVAVGAEMAQGRVAEAEKLAAHCLEISSNALYPSCAAFLGYNPAAEGVKAKTPEGESAFASAKLASGLKGFLSFGGSGG